jgi:hypothetical protein
MLNQLKIYVFFILYFYSLVFGQLYSLETNDQRLIYFGDISSYLAPHVARCFENSLNFHRSLFHYQPKGKISVLLHDFNDYGNAGTDVVPENYILMNIAPSLFIYETSPSNERMNSTLNHELAHVVALDKAEGSDNFFRTLFLGKVQVSAADPISMLYSYWTTPRRFAPRWYHEGFAVFMETWMAGGLGRAQGAYDEMIFRTMVRDSAYFYDVIGLESEGTQVDFQVGVNSYLYGTRFMSYLAYRYTPQKLIDWVVRNKESDGYFASQFKRIYGQPLNKAWSEWIEWEHSFQQHNLELLNSFPLTRFRPLINHELGSVSRSYFDQSDKKLYLAVRYPGQLAYIMALDVRNGKRERICNIKGAALYYVTSLAYDPQNKTLFYTTDNNAWRDLCSVDINTGESKMLIKEARTGDLVFNKTDRSIWGVRHYNGISTLVRIPYPYQSWHQIYSWPYGKDIYDIDLAADGKYLSAALIDETGHQKLILMEVDSLEKGNAGYQVLFDFEYNSPAGFVFSADGKYLYGSSYYSGVSNIYRLEITNRDIVPLSNGQTGFFRPLPLQGDSLLVFQFGAKGFIPGLIPEYPVENIRAIKFLGKELVNTYPVLKTWKAGSPGSINLDSLTTYSGKYNTVKNIRLSSLYPVIQGYKDFTALGLQLNLAGPIGLHQIDFNTTYSPYSNLANQEKLHLGFKYSYMDWQVKASYNHADFYDLFGPTKTSRKGYSFGVNYQKSFIFDLPRTMDLNLSLMTYGDLERLPEYQNVRYPITKMLKGIIGWEYQFLERSLGGVDDEKGYRWQVISDNNYVNKQIYPRLFAIFDYGLPLAWNHSSVWIRSSTGYSFVRHQEPFANFYLGGFGNNWIDHLSEKRYREYYSFPGVELNELGGLNYAKMMLEWNLPPLRFRHWGSTFLYLSWARLSMFSTALLMDYDRLPQRRLISNLGSQLDFRFIALSHLNLTFSLGYAVAFEKSDAISDEVMISLKIL